MNAGTWGEQDSLGEGNRRGLAYSGENETINEAGPACGDDKTACAKSYPLPRGNEDTGLASVKCSFWMQMMLAGRRYDYGGLLEEKVVKPVRWAGEH